MHTPTTTRPDAHLTRAQAAADLTAVREQWGDLLAAIACPPATEWPPRETRGFLDQLAAVTPAEDGWTEEPTTGRVPLVLREHPAPLDLAALDAAREVEEALFTACDVIALRVQRPGPAHPDRWRLPTHRSATLVRGSGIAGAGSRAEGLHWAAVWLEDRATQTGVGGLHLPLPLPVLDDLAQVAHHARQRVDRALNRDGRQVDLDDPCPYCGGALSSRIPPGDPAHWTITCQTGPTCTGPGRYDSKARRHWVGRELTVVGAAILAARGRNTPKSA
ncbi:hypothetical protein QEN61_gp53 [Streptomyces phage Eklok]|uniref:LigA protein n=1 Tax=Streptomyces phage Eklok TaxID=2743999 RepID=A0A7D5K5T1_9CAUD|nr:hypothetical protein QEN61_gp53 [Streptomyces phage Eklok]QLF83237.1 hypothetical protein SEA_EKLOK_53 [Streptomyces phage Eklok]